MRYKSKISVCIPTFNSSKFIKRTIASILKQTYTNFSLHIVDDRSTDDTIKIIERMKDKRIIIHKQNVNKGIFANLNKCLAISSSPYIKIVCADDILESTSLEKQVYILEKNKNVVLVYNSSKIIDLKDKVIFRRKFFNEDKKINGGVLINKILKTGRNPIGEPTSIMLRRATLNKHKLKFSSRFKYVGDLDLWIRLLKHGDGYYINNCLNSFRVHKNSGTAKILHRATKEYMKLFNTYSEEFNLSVFDNFLIKIQLITYFLVKKLLIFLIK